MLDNKSTIKSKMCTIIKITKIKVSCINFNYRHSKYTVFTLWRMCAIVQLLCRS